MGKSDVVSTHYVGEEDNNQSSEEILLSVASRLEEAQLPELALRLALCSHVRIPNENEIDHLAEIEKVFAPKQAKKPTTKKKTLRKPTPAKGKTARKKATKRSAA
jgi:ParB family chromosome partitioning protein